MPWPTTASLPDSVKNAVPSEAGREIFRHAADVHIKAHPGDDQGAMTAGWSALKAAGYMKGADGLWHAMKPQLVKRYNKPSELPESVRKVMPQGAQDMYLEKYNEWWKDHAEDPHADTVAHVLALEYVKTRYYLKGKQWTRRESQLSHLLSSTLKIPHTIPFAVDLAIGSPGGFRRKWVDTCYEGEWDHAEFGKIKITEAMLRQMEQNYHAHVLGTDPPVDVNHMMNDPESWPAGSEAVGWVKGMRLQKHPTPIGVKGDQVQYEDLLHLWTLVEFDAETWDKIEKRRWRYASVSFDENYEDQRTGKRYGAVLAGLAITNTPFLSGLTPILASRAFLGKVELQVNEPATGGSMKELVDQVQSLAMKFDDLVAKFTAAGIQQARELSAMVLLIIDGKIPADAQSTPVAIADLKAIAPDWAAELEAAGTTTVNFLAPGPEVIAAALAALAAPPDAGLGNDPQPSDAGNDPQPKKRVESHTVEVHFTNPTTGKKEAKLMKTVDLDTLLAQRTAPYQKELIRARLDRLAQPNEKGYALPPVIVGMAAGIFARETGKPIQLTKGDDKVAAVMAETMDEAVIELCLALRDKGLVKLSEQASTKSGKPIDGAVIEKLGYGVHNIPSHVRNAIVAEFGESVTTDRDICVQQLFKELRKADEKGTTEDLMAEAERVVDASMPEKED